MAVAPPDKFLNLKRARVLCCDPNQQSQDIIANILHGFGVESLVRASSFDEGKKILSGHVIDLVIVEALLGDHTGYDLVEWLRRSELDPNRYAPVLVVSGHTPQRLVERARDCGANFVAAKPLSASQLMDRVLWVAKTSRAFIEAEHYVGLDRRFKNIGVPAGEVGRRKTDLSADVGEPTGDNMTQRELDDMIKPQKVAL